MCLTLGGTSLPQLVTLSLFMDTLPRRCKIMSCRLSNEIVESTCRHPDIFKMHLLKMHLLFSDSDKNSSSYWCMRNNGLRPPHELLEAPTDGSGGNKNQFHVTEIHKWENQSALWQKKYYLFYHYNTTPRCYNVIEFHNFISTFVQCQIYLSMVS